QVEAKEGRLRCHAFAACAANDRHARRTRLAGGLHHRFDVAFLDQCQDQLETHYSPPLRLRSSINRICAKAKRQPIGASNASSTRPKPSAKGSRPGRFLARLAPNAAMIGTVTTDVAIGPLSRARGTKDRGVRRAAMAIRSNSGTNR